MLNATKLKHWFSENQRQFPWRENRSPYAVWVSEMMLQQTQASVVVSYFDRWMQRFPTIESLANASLDEVLKVWEGLGYYSRARYLHEGAKYILKHHAGNFPHEVHHLKSIKGLGPYTLGAISSFAFHKPVPAVDGNVIRVLTRYFEIDKDISKQKTIKELTDLAFTLLPKQEPWIFNEALIELGATVCGRMPKCHQCPLKPNCKAYINGKTHLFPHKSAKTKVEKLYRTVAVIQCDNQLLVKRGLPGNIMADLYEFPYIETSSDSQDDVHGKMQQMLSCKLTWKSSLDEVSHSFTRYRAYLKPELYTLSKKTEVSTPYSWHSIEELKLFAFSSGHRRIFNAVFLK